MNNFGYARATDIADAVRQITADPQAKFIAGGTNIVDLIKEHVAQPSRLIDITHLPLNRVEETKDGGLRIGALVPNSDLAWHPQVEARYPLLASAILAGASQQLRNMATTGGNLLQRTRCFYFYDTSTPCNKRESGSGCSAIGGVNRMHAILGTSEHCIATHPSDMCVALAALDARVLASGPAGERSIAFTDFHRLPGDTPQIDSNLRADELITAVELPPKGFPANYSYLKIRDRLSYAFALVSVAVGLEIEGGTIKEARLALGGVAHKPWRNREAEAELNGAPATRTRRGRISHARRAPQRHGDVRSDRGLGRRRPDHGLRQDPGAAELPRLRRQRIRPTPGRSARIVPLCRRWIRFRTAAAIRAAACGSRRTGAQALGAGGVDPPADVHARLPRRQHPIAGAGGRS
jgi:xanthine dehydrogenase YagS FAD-binding subunit